MATGSYDFTGTNGDPPTGFTRTVYGDPNFYTVEIETDAGSEGGQALRITDTGVGATEAWVYDAPGVLVPSTDGDLEAVLYVEFTTLPADGNPLPLSFNAEETGTNGNVVSAWFTNSLADLQVGTSYGVESTTPWTQGTAGPHSLTIATGVIYALRIQYTDTSVAAKIWVAGSSEPGSYQATAGAQGSENGYIGFQCLGQYDPYLLHYISYGTGGDAAPVPGGGSSSSILPLLNAYYS